MKVSTITSKDEMYNRRDIWKQVSEYSTIFNLYDWYYNWWNYYGKDKELKIFIAENDVDEVLAILPMMKYRKDGITYLTQLAGPNTDYFSIILNTYNGQAVDEIICYIKGNESYDRFIISNLRSDEFNTDFLIKSAISIYNDVEIITQGKIFFIDSTGDYEDYIKEKSRNFRHKFNQLKKIEKRYCFEVLKFYSESVIREIIRLHKKRWIDEMQLSVFFDKKRVDFTCSILKTYAKYGYLRVFLLKDDEKIVSYRMGFVFNKVYYDWNTAFDLEYENDSVGIILCNHVIEYCFNNDITEFDFLRGEENYKKGFSNGIRNYRAIEFKTNKELENYVFIPPRQRIRKDIKYLNKIIWAMSYTGDKFNCLCKSASFKNIEIKIWNNEKIKPDVKEDGLYTTMVIGDVPETVMKLANSCNAMSCLCINELSFMDYVCKPDIVVTDIDKVINLINYKE